MHSPFVYVLILVCLFSTNVSANLVPSICKELSKHDKQNVRYDFCVSSLESDRQSSSATANQLGEISLRLTISKAEEVLSSIDNVVKQSRIDQRVEHILTACSFIYSNFPAVLKDGLTALKGERYNEVNVTVSQVVKRATVCGNAIQFADGRGVSQVKELTGVFGKLCAISLGFTYVLRIVN